MRNTEFSGFVQVSFIGEKTYIKIPKNGIAIIQYNKFNLLANAFSPSCTFIGLKWNGIILGGELHCTSFRTMSNNDTINISLLNI